MEQRPGSFKLYKSKGALQASLLTPRYNDKGFIDKEGAVLLEAAPGAGKQLWDWDKKVTFAISYADIANLLDNTTPQKRIFHEHQDTPKVLELIPGEGDYIGTYQLRLSKGKDKERMMVMVPLTNGEWTLFLRLLLEAVPLMINWTPRALANN